jgi:hypothetical protein
MADDSNPHSLQQVTPHLQKIDYGLAQLRTLGLQKGKLLNPFPALPFGLLPSMIDVGRHARQTLGVCFGSIPSLVTIRELAL